MSFIKKMVENPHPVYKRYHNYWNFLLRSYEGGIDYTNCDVPQNDSSGLVVTYRGQKVDNNQDAYNLFKHKKERAEDYKERVRMSYYYNFCAPIIDIYTNHLFKEPVHQDFGSIDKIVQTRIDNVDRQGSSLEEFRKEVSENSQIFGHLFVVTDMPINTGEVSLQQRFENDKLPYFSQFYPTDVLNWSLDVNGNPYWVLLRERVDANSNPMAYDKDNHERCNYRLWTREEWILFDEDYQEIIREKNPTGKVPINVFYDKKSKKVKNFMSVSSIADISFISRDVYNKCSELNEILRNQTFAILALQGKSSDYDEISVGISKALLYPEDTNAPQYVSPPSDNARIIMDQINNQIGKMFQLAKLEGGSAAKEQEVSVQSGVSKAYDFHETNSALTKKSSNMEDGELRMWSNFAAWEGKEFDGNINYPRNFSVKELSADLEEAEQLVKMNLGQMFNNKIKESVIKKKFPRISDQEIDQMIEEAKSQGGNIGGQLSSRLPNLFNKNAEPSGN